MTDQIVIPAKPGHRIVLVSPDVAYYEHVETGERTAIDIPPMLARALATLPKKQSTGAVDTHAQHRER